MPLKYHVESLDGVPESVRSEYKEAEDGKGFVLQVEGAVPKAKVDEFRENNITLNNRVKEYEGKLKAFEGIDPAEWPALVELKTKVANKDLIDKNGFEGALEARIKESRTKFEEQLALANTKVAEAEKGVNTYKSRFENMVIGQALLDAAIKNEANDKALEDIKLRGGAIWRVKDDKIVALDANGEPLYDSDGLKPLTMDGWMKKLREDAPHLFKGSNGGGAGGSGGGSGFGHITKKSDLKTPAEKAAFINKNGGDAYLKLPA